MGTKLSREDAALYHRIDEVLHYIWDPIGVAGAPGARDEYNAYLPRVFALVRDRAPEHEIVSFLLGVEVEQMGLSFSGREKAEQVAGICSEWREWIEEFGG